MKCFYILLLCLLAGCGTVKREQEYQQDKAMQKHMSRREGRDTNLEIYGDKYVDVRGEKLVRQLGDRYVDIRDRELYIQLGDAWALDRWKKIRRMLHAGAGSSVGTGLLAWFFMRFRARNGKKNGKIVKEVLNTLSNGTDTES